MSRTALPSAAPLALRRNTAAVSTAAGIGGLTLVLSLLALLGPDLTVSNTSMGMAMGMTHYMELLGIGSPRNLLLFMGVPVVLAETLAITEIALLFKPDQPTWVRKLNRAAGLLAGPAMVAIFLHLALRAVVPITLTGSWRGPADIIAVGFYLAGVVPFAGITLVELGLLGDTQHEARRLRAVFISVFLVVAHVAMIFGMMDPGVLGYLMHH